MRQSFYEKGLPRLFSGSSAPYLYLRHEAIAQGLI